MSQATLDSPDASPLVGQIQNLVRSNSRRWKMLVVLEAVGLAVSALLAYLWLVFWLDNTVHLPRAGRLAAGVGLLIGVLYIGVQLVRRRRLLQLSEDQVALAIERRTSSSSVGGGGVQNRLINALQIARASNSKHAAPEHAELSRAIIAENVAGIRDLELEQAAAVRPAVLRVGVALLLAGVGVAFYHYQPERFTNAASRILLPLADVDPIYRTRLRVAPGDIETADDVTLSIYIDGERPSELVLLEDVDGKRTSTPIVVSAEGNLVRHTLRRLEQSRLYAVRGGDFTTRFYQITVPTPSHLALLRANYHYPVYTGLADKASEGVAGTVEAIRGTTVDLTVVLDRPCEGATMVVEHAPVVNPSGAAAEGAAAKATAPQRIELKRQSPTEFAARITLADQTAYRVETRQVDTRGAVREPHSNSGARVHLGKPHVIRVTPDREPTLELRGLEGKTSATVDATLPLKISAGDDWGLAEVGLFVRRAPAGAATGAAQGAVDWTSIQTWKIDATNKDGTAKFEQALDFTLLAASAVEGERLEVALRAKDRDPGKGDRWTEGTLYTLEVGGDNAALQLLYEQIIRTETELKEIMTAERRVMVETVEWLRKLDGEGGLKWDDPKNIGALHGVVADLNKRQGALRERAGGAARGMVEQAGSLRMSVGLLADTEMVRAERIFESVAARDQWQGKRSAMSDAQLTFQRTLTSLQEMTDAYAKFRKDWELAHMTDFVKMLAERQALLAEASAANVDRKNDPYAEARRKSAHKRQEKIVDLTGLSETALVGLGDMLAEIDSPLAEPFTTAGDAMAGDELQKPLGEATAAVEAGKWKEAAASQTKAAEQLTAIHGALRQAQIDAARETLAALEEQAKSDAEAQKAIDKLKAGSDTSQIGLPEKMPVKDLIEMRKELDIRKRGGNVSPDAKVTDYVVTAATVAKLATPDSGRRQEFDILKLGESAGAKTPQFPGTSDRESNEVVAPIQEELKDLVGELLEEADEMQDKYETATLNTSFNINEAGEVGKLGGDMNSSAAAATTGNKKPPTRNVGGASRSGRRGARAHGIVVGDESVNRRGRDQVQEGQERVADQAGLIRETKSDDPQNDTSTGVGGKKVESDDTKFSVADAGKWTDDMASRMGKPQDKNYIVERQDGRMDPRVAEMLRDLTSDHEQIIERAKTIRKELKNLYLPTDHLDEILAELEGQLDRMRERPTAELFRLEMQTLDKLRGTLRVFHQAHAGFQPSLPREQQVRGRVLDDADPPPPAGYEEAVKRYYEKLSVGTSGASK